MNGRCHRKGAGISTRRKGGEPRRATGVRAAPTPVALRGPRTSSVLKSFVRRSDLRQDSDLTCSMAAWRRRFSAWRSFASLVHACHPGARKRTADSRRSHGARRFAPMIEPPHSGCGRQAALCRTVYFVGPRQARVVIPCLPGPPQIPRAPDRIGE